MLLNLKIVWDRWTKIVVTVKVMGRFRSFRRKRWQNSKNKIKSKQNKTIS